MKRQAEKRKRSKAGGDFNWNTELAWRDMLIDAPSRFTPQFLDTVEDPRLKAHLDSLYRQLRRDSDNGNGVSLMRDLVMRRIVWSIRILERAEQGLEEWEFKVIAGVEGAEENLVGYMRLHSRQLEMLLRAINTIKVDMPPLKSVEQLIGDKSSGADKVIITD